MMREDAYAAVQRNAMKGWRGEGAFIDLLRADPDVRRRLSDEELKGLFDPAWHFAHVDEIFARVFGRESV
jgi:adenylosuccinate lyase